MNAPSVASNLTNSHTINKKQNKKQNKKVIYSYPVMPPPNLCKHLLDKGKNKGNYCACKLKKQYEKNGWCGKHIKKHI